jgi:hypothetical protein
MAAAPSSPASFFQGIPVELEERNVYGELKLYPHNRLARALAEFRGTRTFTPVMVEQLKAMGFTVLVAGTNARTL